MTITTPAFDHDGSERAQYPVVRSAADSLLADIDRMCGHSARALLRRLVEDLTTHPDELGNAVATLRMIERHAPARPLAAIEHGITVNEIRLPAGTPLRASCLCGWLSPIVGSRPQAAEAGGAHLDASRPRPTRASHCSCGRPARQVLDGGAFGPTGYCGAPFRPLDPCDCGKGAERHDRTVCHIYGRGLVMPSGCTYTR